MLPIEVWVGLHFYPKKNRRKMGFCYTLFGGDRERERERGLFAPHERGSEMVRFAHRWAMVMAMGDVDDSDGDDNDDRNGDQWVIFCFPLLLLLSSFTEIQRHELKFSNSYLIFHNS